MSQKQDLCRRKATLYFVTRIELALKALFDSMLGYYMNKMIILNPFNVLNLNSMEKPKNTAKRPFLLRHDDVIIATPLANTLKCKSSLKHSFCVIFHFISPNITGFTEGGGTLCPSLAISRPKKPSPDRVKAYSARRLWQGCGKGEGERAEGVYADLNRETFLDIHGMTTRPGDYSQDLGTGIKKQDPGKRLLQGYLLLPCMATPLSTSFHFITEFSSNINELFQTSANSTMEKYFENK